MNIVFKKTSRNNDNIRVYNNINVMNKRLNREIYRVNKEENRKDKEKRRHREDKEKRREDKKKRRDRENKENKEDKENKENKEEHRKKRWYDYSYKYNTTEELFLELKKLNIIIK